MKMEQWKRIATKATPGPWEPVSLTHRSSEYGLHIDMTVVAPGRTEDEAGSHDTDFAATFNPQLVQKLLAVVEAAEEALAELLDAHANDPYACAVRSAERLELALDALEDEPCD